MIEDTIAQNSWRYSVCLEHCTNLYLYNLSLTPSQDKEEPPLLGELAKNHHQHEVEHDTFTQHPAEGSKKEIVQQGRHKCTGNLHDGKSIAMKWIYPLWNGPVKSIVVLCHFILLTVLLVAVSMPNIKTRYPSSKEMARFRWTNIWTAWNSFFL